METDANFDKKKVNFRIQGTSSSNHYRPLTLGERLRYAQRSLKIEEGKKMIEESFCSFEIAKLLDAAGFIPTMGCVCIIYNENGESVSFDNKYAKIFYQAPTLAVAMRWLRKEKRIFATIGISQYAETYSYYFDYITSTDGKHIFSDKKYTSYEEATDALIRYCLENIILKNNRHDKAIIY